MRGPKTAITSSPMYFSAVPSSLPSSTGAVGAKTAVRLAQQVPQKANPSGLTVPQERQAVPNFVPHWPQNFVPPGLSKPHCGHRIEDPQLEGVTSLVVHALRGFLYREVVPVFSRCVGGAVPHRE